ncbi:MAG: integrase family protein, partial [Actinoallomurus sp.]|nr:integrase family protein [Actinoallomurus sp.]
MGYVRTRYRRDGCPRHTAYYWDVRGRERSAGTFALKKDAVRAWRRAEARTGEGRFIDLRSGRQSFARYVAQVWLVDHRMEANTRQGHTSVINRYLLPEFGAMRMIEILPSHVRDFLRRLTEGGRSATTVQRCKTVLSSIFTTALNDQVIFLHPCSGVAVPPVPVRPLRIITPPEFEAIMAALPDEQARLLAEVAIQAGLRWGELVELRVGDLDPATCRSEPESNVRAAQGIVDPVAVVDEVGQEVHGEHPVANLGHGRLPWVERGERGGRQAVRSRSSVKIRSVPGMSAAASSG